MSPRLATSLVTLRAEVNAAFPERSKASDGWIGDPDHASRASRHNPNQRGVVCAFDVTHDPDDGVDCHDLVDTLLADPHPCLEYIIWNGRIAKRRTGFVWERYYGVNRHTKHAHVAVGRGPDSEPTPPYDSTAPWGIDHLENDMTPAERSQLIDDIAEAVQHKLLIEDTAWLDVRLAVVYDRIRTHSTTMRDSLAGLIREKATALTELVRERTK